MLYQYIIKVLMGNSDTIFTGLVMGVLGYMGWLLWKINERLKDFSREWNNYAQQIDSIKDKVHNFDQETYHELSRRIEENVKFTDRLLLIVEDNNNELERMNTSIITEIKDSANDIKEIMMVLMNNRSRSISNTEKDQNMTLSAELEEKIDYIIDRKCEIQEKEINNKMPKIVEQIPTGDYKEYFKKTDIE